MSADWVATVALGKLARSANAREDKFPKAHGEIQLQAFWAPFLLIHLGGPDTITAYAIEELWPRHLLSLVVQGWVAIYVYVRFWSTSVLTYLATPIFIVGAFKYGERVFVLYSSTKERLKKLHFLQVIDRKRIEEIRETNRRLFEVYTLIHSCACLLTGQVLEYKDGQIGRMILLGEEEEGIKEKSAEEIFKITAIELGFMYDWLHTKAKIIYSGFGISARCLSLLTSVTALVGFSIFIHSPAHPLADVIMSQS